MCELCVCVSTSNKRRRRWWWCKLVDHGTFWLSACPRAYPPRPQSRTALHRTRCWRVLSESTQLTYSELKRTSLFRLTDVKQCAVFASNKSTLAVLLLLRTITDSKHPSFCQLQLRHCRTESTSYHPTSLPFRTNRPVPSIQVPERSSNTNLLATPYGISHGPFPFLHNLPGTLCLNTISVSTNYQPSNVNWNLIYFTCAFSVKSPCASASDSFYDFWCFINKLKVYVDFYSASSQLYL